MKCSTCNSVEYVILFSHTRAKFEDEPQIFYYCVRCINRKLQGYLGDDFLTILSNFQKLDEIEYQKEQMEVSLHLKIKETLTKKRGKSFASQFAGEEEL